MKSRPYGSWTRQEGATTYYKVGRRPARPTETDTPRGPRYDRLLLVLVGVVLISVSVGLVFADVQKAGEAVPAGPRDESLELNIPSMKRVENVPVYGDPMKDEAALHDGTLHVDGTGFPWQREANVYIAGHRIGYPRTDSFFVFWDLHKLKRGKRVVLTDAEDTKYVYRVFDRFVVGPNEVSVKKPLEGKNIVSLQTCTLPNYSDRLIVRAELKKTIEPPVQQANAGTNAETSAE